MANLIRCYVAGNDKGEKGYLIAFEYDTELVEALKSRIPHTHREWRRSEKAWWVSEVYGNVLKELFSNFYALAFLQGKLW